MVFNSESLPLFEQYKLVRAVENEAITALYSAMKSGVRDTQTLLDLTERMTDAHNNSMDI